MRVHTKLLLSLACALGSTCALAGSYTFAHTPDPTASPSNTTAQVRYVQPAGDTTQETEIQLMLPAGFTATAPVSNPAGSVCTVIGGNVIRTVPPSGGGTPLAAGTYGCDFTVAVPAAQTDGDKPLTVNLIECVGDPAPATCAPPVNPHITVGAPPADVSPNLAYNPVSGGSITLTAAGANATGNIVVTPSGGTGAATTTMGTCSFAANTASLATTPPTLTFTGNTTTPQNRALTCVRQPAAVTALLTCQETQSDGTPAGPQPRTFNVTCPAAAPGDVSPNVAFSPNPLTLTGTGTASGTLVGTPSGGTGAATTMATCVDDAGGPAFTITPASRTFTGSSTTTS